MVFIFGVAPKLYWDPSIIAHATVVGSSGNSSGLQIQPKKNHNVLE